MNHLYTKLKIATKIFIPFFILFVALCSAQSNQNCLKEEQILKLQSEPLDSSSLLLNKLSFTFQGTGQLDKFNYLDPSLRLNMTKWSHESYTNDALFLCLSQKPSNNVLIIKTSENCYRSLFSSISSSSHCTSRIIGNTIASSFLKGKICVEFREFKNEQKRSQSEFYVLAYNPSFNKYNQIRIGLSENDWQSNSDEMGNDDATLDTKIENPQINVKEEEDDKVYQMVDEMPVFPGGEEKFLWYVRDNLKYPTFAKQNGISGRVIVQFIIGKDGKVYDAKVTRGIGGGCDEEALRVFNSMPIWKPGRHNGHNVKVMYTLPVNFNL